MKQTIKDIKIGAAILLDKFYDLWDAMHYYGLVAWGAIKKAAKGIAVWAGKWLGTGVLVLLAALVMLVAHGLLSGDWSLPTKGDLTFAMAMALVHIWLWERKEPPINVVITQDQVEAYARTTAAALNANADKKD